MPTIQNTPNPPPKPPWPPQASPRTKPVPSVEQIREQLRLFLILLLGLIIVTQLPLPFQLAGLVLSVAIGWVGIRLLRGMRSLGRTGVSVRGGPSVIIGLGLAGLLTIVLIAQAIFYPYAIERERCVAEANTLTAQDACDKTYQDRLDRLTEDLRRRTTTP